MMHPVLDFPVTASNIENFGRSSARRRDGSYSVNDLRSCPDDLSLSEFLTYAFDAERLPSPGQFDVPVPGFVEFDNQTSASVDSTVRFFDRLAFTDLLIVPVNRFQIVEYRLLIALDDHKIVGSPVQYQLGSLNLSVHGVGGHNAPGQLHAPQQLSRSRNLV